MFGAKDASFAKISSGLPRFDEDGDLMGEGGSQKANPASLETMGNLEKDLLKSQLNDLDGWITKVRDMETQGRPTGPLPSAVDVEDLAPPGVESLLRAQVQELEGWLIEARTPLRQDQALISEPDADEALLLNLRRERHMTVRTKLQPKDETAHAQQRLESAFETLRHMKEAETQRDLALQQSRSVGLRTNEDFSRLFSQLHELEADPMRAPDLARYSITDVALSIVNAIEQRRVLAVSLQAALVAQDRMRLGAESYEQLLTCASADQVVRKHVSVDGLESSEVLYAPAGQLTLPEGPLSDEVVDTNDQSVARLHKLAEVNRALWEQMYGRWDSNRVRRGPGLDGKLFADSGFSGAGNALQSELRSLRANEGRLDDLLGPGGGQGAINASGVLSSLPTVKDYVEREEELNRLMKPARIAGFGKLDLGPFTTLTMEQILTSWYETAHKLCVWRANRRAEACERFLNHKVSAQAIRFLLGSIQIEVACPVPKNLARGSRVKDMVTNRVGTFMSATPKGICKIQWGPDDVGLSPISKLAWLSTYNHPAFAGLFFLAWARILVLREKKQVIKFRSKVMGTKDQGRSTNMLVWLSAQANDPITLTRLCFESWAKLSAARQSAYKDLLADVFMVWRHGALNGRHSRAVVELESTSAELRSARLTLLKQTKRFDRMERQMIKIDDMQNGLYLSYVMSSWHYAIRMGRMEDAVAAQGKADRLRMAAMLCGKMSDELVKRLLPAMFMAWHMRTRNTHEAGKRNKLFSASFSQATLSVAFHAWKYLVTGVHQQNVDHQVQELTQLVEEKSEDFKRLQKVTEELYGFSKEADGRVKELESALQAADKAVEAGGTHGGILEKEVSSLETQLRALEARVRRGEEAERDLKSERDVSSNLKIELSTHRGEKESIANKLGVLETKLNTTEAQLEKGKREVAAFNSERAIIESALEAARSDAIEWKRRWEDQGGGFGDRLDDMSDESDIMEALEQDAEGRLTSKGKKDLKKAVKAGKVTAASAAAMTQGKYKGGGRTDAHQESQKERVWLPDGDYLPPWSACMPFEKAEDVVAFGADITKKTPGSVFNKTELMFFVVFEGQDDKYLCYYKNKEEQAGGVARGAFSLRDVANAEWNGQTREIKLYQSGKKDEAPRTLSNIPHGFFEALLVVTREAEYRRIHAIFHGPPAIVKGNRGDDDDEGEGDGGDVDGFDLPSKMTPAKDPKREEQRRKRKEAAERAIAERLADV